MMTPIPEPKIWELLGFPQDVAPNSMYVEAFKSIVQLVRRVEQYHEQERKQ